MTDGHKPGNTPRCMPLVAAVLAAAVILLPAAPADAGLLGRSIGVGGAGHSLKKNLGRLIERAFEMADAGMDGDKRRANKIWEDVKKTPARIVKDAFPVLKLGAAAKDRLKSAENRIKRFAGKAGEAISGARASASGKARSLVTDARAALAVNADEKGLYRSATGILGKKPLPAAKAKAASGGSGSPWFKEWVLKQQRDHPECWGVVKAGTDPEECMAREKARKEAEKSAIASASGTAGASTAAERGGVSGDRSAEGTGWSGWDRSDSRYGGEDREAARVSLYAARCWGIDGVSNSVYDPMFPLMKRRMRNNECPEEDKARKPADDSKDDYEQTLAKALGEDNKAAGDAPEEDSYQAALSALDEKEAEQLRAEEEHRRQAKLAEQQRRAEKERRRQAKLTEQRRAEKEKKERGPQISEAEGRRLKPGRACHFTTDTCAYRDSYALLTKTAHQRALAAKSRSLDAQSASYRGPAAQAAYDAAAAATEEAIVLGTAYQDAIARCGGGNIYAATMEERNAAKYAASVAGLRAWLAVLSNVTDSKLIAHTHKYMDAALYGLDSFASVMGRSAAHTAVAACIDNGGD